MSLEKKETEVKLLEVVENGAADVIIEEIVYKETNPDAKLDMWVNFK